MPTIIRCVALEHGGSFHKRVSEETALALIQQRGAVVICEKLDADAMRRVVSNNVTCVNDVTSVIVVDK